MAEIIDAGALQLRFLQSRETTGAEIDLFEMRLAPEGRMPVPHYHESWDETVYGLEGRVTFILDGVEVPIGPGDSAFIRRGVVHGFRNDSGAPARCLAMLSPGALGPAYFREIAALLARQPPDAAAMGAVMRRYGLVPVLTA